MSWRPFKVFIASINVMCVLLLAGIYVFTYYDYLHTETDNGRITISDTQGSD